MIMRTLGSPGLPVSAIGLGCMGMSGTYGPADRSESIATLHAALDAGVTLLDTGDFYGMGHNELLIAEALRGRPRDQVQLSVKFGALRGPGAYEWNGYDSRPAAIRNFVAYSLTRLGTDYIDIYRPARLDPDVPIEDTMGALAELVRQGHIRHIGLSEVGAATLRRAHAVHPVIDLQIEYAIITRGIEAAILPTARALGIGVTAYGVLGRGLLSGRFLTSGSFAPGDLRSRNPRFAPDNLARNLALADRLSRIGTTHGATAGQIAIAWVLSRGPDIVPLIGARRRDQLSESLAALNLSLTQDDLATLDSTLPPAAGGRYPTAQLAHLDSERGE